MTAATIPSTSITQWPRAAVATILALLVALVVAIGLALTTQASTTTKTVVVRTPVTAQPPDVCRMGRPC
jgi:capsular polysaccharide biosynthesis protein